MVELRKLYTVTPSLAKGHYLLLYPKCLYWLCCWDCHSSRSVWTMISNIRFDLWVVLCEARSWTQSLGVPSNSGYVMIPSLLCWWTSSWMIWLLEQNVPSVGLQRVGEAAGCTCAASQKDLNRQKRCTGRNIVNFSRRKCKVLHLRKNYHWQFILGPSGWRSPLQNSLSISGCLLLTMSQQCTLVVSKAKSLPSCKRKEGQS